MDETVWFLQQPTTVFQKVLLVWGKQAFDNVSNRKKNPLLKKSDKQFGNANLKIIVFEIEKEQQIPMTTVQIYGGDPVLLIDMELFHYQTVMEAILKHPKSHIWALNLPFWTHQCVILNEANIGLLTGYKEKIKALNLLRKLTQLDSVCHCCFVRTPEIQREQFCGHAHCAKCEFGKLCYHPDHKLEPNHIKYSFI